LLKTTLNTKAWGFVTGIQRSSIDREDVAGKVPRTVSIL
jgi:hypothetical protein